MARFIFYTSEGSSEAPNGEDVENCQMLGYAEGENANLALERLLRENAWIGEHGYKELSACEVTGEPVYFLTTS